MNRLRALLVLLLCLSLPGWAVAGQWQDAGCPHHGFGAAANQHLHHHGGGKGCADETQCQCAHHCAGGASLAAPGSGAMERLVFERPLLAVDRYAGLTAQAHTGFPFRPPIAAPAGAA